MRTKNLVKAARTKEVMGRRRSPMLRELSFKVLPPKHVALIMRIFNLIIDDFKHGRY